jgi:hypothetical protein
MAMAEPFNNVTEARLIKQWMPRECGETHICFDNGKIDFQWSNQEVKEFRELWVNGAPLDEIQDHFNRPQNDVAVLIMDQSILGRIDPREKGLWA